MSGTKIFTRPVIRELLRSMSLDNVNFDINSDGEYVITVGNDVIQSDQAKATYMALTGIETGYHIGLAKASGSDPAIYNRPMRLKDTKLAKAYKQARQEVKDLTKENNYLLSESWKKDVLQEEMVRKLTENPAKAKYYFIYLWTNGKLSTVDRVTWAGQLMDKLGNISPDYPLSILFNEKVATHLVEKYFHIIWELW